MVCLAKETVVESARLDLRPGLDGSLHDDGNSGMAGVAKGRMEQATQAARDLSCAARSQRALDALVLRLASPGVGVGRDRSPLAGDRDDDGCFSSGEPRRDAVAGALSGVGKFRD